MTTELVFAAVTLLFVTLVLIGFVLCEGSITGYQRHE